MFGPCEHADESPEDELETSLCVSGRKVWYRRLFSKNERQLRHHVDHEPTVRADRFSQGVSPMRQIGFALRQPRPEKALKRLRDGGIGNISLVLVELACCEQTTRRNQRLMEFIDHGGLADAGISGNEHQLGPAGRHDTIEGSEQGFDLALTAVQLFWNHEAVVDVVFARREIVNTARQLPVVQ